MTDDGGGGDSMIMNNSSLICLQGIISIKMSVISVLLTLSHLKKVSRINTFCSALWVATSQLVLSNQTLSIYLYKHTSIVINGCTKNN
jgi:hypothetical protein